MADNNQADQGNGEKITPEMVQQVADKVYKMLLLEMNVERDRQRPANRQVQYHKRGR
jgi:hypothetical protein